MNLSFIDALLSTEIFSIIICAILYYCNKFESHQSSKRVKLYSLMVGTNIVALIADALSWIFEGREDCTFLLEFCTVISVVLALILIGEFAVYITAYIAEHRAISVPVYYAALAAITLAAAVTLIACVCGLVFTYESGCYTLGPLYIVYDIVNIISLLVCIIVVTYYHKDLGTHDSIIAYIYILIPAIGAVISVITDGYSFAYPAATLSLLILFVTIQNDHADMLEQEKQTTQYFASHDELTGLLSRRAYTEKADALAETEGNVGIIFCDVNGLKFTNDHYGHVAGDQLLVLFAKLLSKHFPSEQVFRTGGDEFIILIPNAEKKSFDKQVSKLESALLVDGQLVACMGSDFGECKNIQALATTAEDQMYENKDIFHASRPEMTR